MQTSPEAFIAILGMALVTIAIKAGGLLLADRLPRQGFAAAWLRHIPGAVLAALVAPALVTGSPAEMIAAIATGGIFILTRNLFAAMAAGVLAVYLARLMLAS
ncbi:MAG: branched-chain amino acid transport [Hyphomonas sp.]|nr:branched-chain amino acid transport [Hyphomonas sp.]|tara:strand:+ start:84 stop:392 length:309 start_codon:yes stop_codon:yes gene_type:complete